MIYGGQVAQARPAGTAAVAAFSTSGLKIEVKAVWICNTSGGNADYSLYHDDDGTTYDATTALAFGVTLATKSYVWLKAEDFGTGLIIAPARSGQTGGTIAIQTSVGSALTFTFYGVAEDSR